MGPYDWMPEVLDDLQAFAKASEFPHLAEMLADTKLVALASIATREKRRVMPVKSDEAHDSSRHGSIRDGPVSHLKLL